MSAEQYRKEIVPQARARFARGVMNGTEASYAAQLELRKRAGQIADYRFEALTLKLAHDTRYTADFLVIKADGGIELHEVKGFLREDANVKLKTAAALFPWFRFVVIYRRGTKADPIWAAREVPAS